MTTTDINGTEIPSIRIVDWFEIRGVPYRGTPTRIIEAVLKETEKAYYVATTYSTPRNDRGVFKTWVPKKCTEAYADYIARQRAEEERRKAAMEAGKARYDALVAYAKAQGVKGVRAGLRTATIVEKLRGAGVPVPEWVKIKEAH